MENGTRFGIAVPEVYLPAKSTEYEKWAVVACDQYTSQPDYWSCVENLVGTGPSALKLILPEIYLKKPDNEERIKKINRTMEDYLKKSILVSQGEAFIYVDRKTSHAASRKGLIAALDLERYEYSKGADSLVRATEGTVIERLPPRIKIRENAIIELPHIMVLIDDPGKSVIEPIAAQSDKLDLLYDFDLMMDGGHVKGCRVDDRAMQDAVFEALGKLADPAGYMKKYGVNAEKGVLLYAVGDGNHSLASAKAYWDKLKRENPTNIPDNHPSRFALVELVNVHDEGLQFEPIHRVLFNVDSAKVINSMCEYYGKKGSVAEYRYFGSPEELKAAADVKRPDLHIIPFISEKASGIIYIEKSGFNLEVGTLQCFLDEFLSVNSDIRIDYIHGDAVVEDLGSRPGNMGFFLPAMDKHDLFKTVILDGALPRKTFSMGEAEEKRFYLECRKIR